MLSFGVWGKFRNREVAGYGQFALPALALYVNWS